MYPSIRAVSRAAAGDAERRRDRWRRGRSMLLCRTCAPRGSGTRLSAEAMLFLKNATSVAPDDCSNNAVAGAARRARARSRAPPPASTCISIRISSPPASSGECGRAAGSRRTGHSSMVTLQQLIFKLSEFWTSRGCLLQQPLDIEMGAGTMHPETFLRVLGPQPVEHRLRAAIAAARRRPLRREPEPPLQAPAVPGDPEARARRSAAALPAEPGSLRHRPACPRRTFRGKQLGVAHARRVGHRLAGALRQAGDHAVPHISSRPAASISRQSRSS